MNIINQKLCAYLECTITWQIR